MITMEINNKEDSESFFEAEYEVISPIEKISRGM